MVYCQGGVRHVVTQCACFIYSRLPWAYFCSYSHPPVHPGHTKKVKNKEKKKTRKKEKRRRKKKEKKREEIKKEERERTKQKKERKTKKQI